MAFSFYHFFDAEVELPEELLVKLWDYSTRLKRVYKKYLQPEQSNQFALGNGVDLLGKI